VGEMTARFTYLNSPKGRSPMATTRMRLGHIGSLFVFSLIVNFASAATITVPIKVGPNPASNLEDTVIKFGGANDKVTRVVDHDGFPMPANESNPNVRTVKFTGGNLGANASDSIIVETDGTSTSYRVLKY
jgi:hypothetical protein